MRLARSRQGLPSLCATLTPVLGLLLLRSPSAIPGRVRPVIVDPINAVRWGRTGPHVSVELLKGRPLAGNGDATPAIVSVGMVSCPQTSGSHSKPGVVLRDTAESVLYPGNSQDLLLPAPTRDGRAASQVSARYRPDLATVATARPLDVHVGCALRIFGKDHEQPKTGTRQHGNLWGHHDLHRGVTGPDVRSVAAPLRCSNYTIPHRQVLIILRENQSRQGQEGQV